MKKYRQTSQGLVKVIYKKGFFGYEEHLEDISNVELFSEGWAFVRMDSNRNGIFHYYEKNIQHSFCGRSISDIPKKRLYIDPKTFKSQKYRSCKNCVIQLREFKITGTRPYDKLKEEPYTLTPKIIKYSPNYQKKYFKSNHKNFKQVDAVCSYPTCPETGITYVREDKDVTTNPHFCIKHNPKIKETH